MGVIFDIECAFSSSGDEERMMEDCISICGFLEDINSKKEKGPTPFKDGTGIQEKSARRGLVPLQVFLEI